MESTESGTDEPIFRAAIETKTNRTDPWDTVGEGDSWIERIALKAIYYHMWKIDSQWEFAI